MKIADMILGNIISGERSYYSNNNLVCAQYYVQLFGNGNNDKER